MSRLSIELLETVGQIPAMSCCIFASILYGSCYVDAEEDKKIHRSEIINNNNGDRVGDGDYGGVIVIKNREITKGREFERSFGVRFCKIRSDFSEVLFFSDR